MPAEHHKESWEQLEVLLAKADGDRLGAFLGTVPPGETARAVSRLSRENQEQLLTLLSPRQAADLVVELPRAQAAELLGAVPPARAAAVLGCLPSDERADLLGELDTDQSGRSWRSWPPRWQKAPGDSPSTRRRRPAGS